MYSSVVCLSRIGFLLCYPIGFSLLLLMPSFFFFLYNYFAYFSFFFSQVFEFNWLVKLLCLFNLFPNFSRS